MSKECCGTCKFNARYGEDTFACDNPDSDYYACDTAYDDDCADYESKGE